MGSLGWQKMIVPVFKSVICSFVMGAGLWMFMGWLGAPEDFSKIDAFRRVLAGIGVGITLYLVPALMLKCRELDHMLAMFKKG